MHSMTRQKHKIYNKLHIRLKYQLQSVLQRQINRIFDKCIILAVRIKIMNNTNVTQIRKKLQKTELMGNIIVILIIKRLVTKTTRKVIKASKPGALKVYLSTS